MNPIDIRRLSAATLMTAMAATTQLGATAAHADPLASYRRSKRVLVIVAQTARNEAVAAQRQNFQGASQGMAERDVVLVEAIGDEPVAQAIRKQLAVGNQSFQVLLVGKDGHTAASSATPIPASEIFGRIDAMPMRRDEVRRKSR